MDDKSSRNVTFLCVPVFTLVGYRNGSGTVIKWRYIGQSPDIQVLITVSLHRASQVLTESSLYPLFDIKQLL